MKLLIKSVLTRLLGERRVRALVRTLKSQKASFSEADLIYEYFLSRKAPGTMVDVGAHFGESLRPYLERGWKIVAFEPDSRNRARLLKEVDAGRIDLRPVAVSDHESAEVTFFTSEESDGISSLSAFRPTHVEAEYVRLTTLEKILTPEVVAEVTFLKIDTEGHDLFVLKGFPWERYQPEVILCEFEDSKTKPLGYDYRAMGDYLIARGFSVFLSEWDPIVRYGVTHNWRCWQKYPAAVVDDEGWGNFVAFRPGSDLQAVEKYLSSFKMRTI